LLIACLGNRAKYSSTALGKQGEWSSRRQASVSEEFDADARPERQSSGRNLFEIVAYLQDAEGMRFEVRSARAALRTKKRKHIPRMKRVASSALRR
jgi:hypothetical protein